MRYGVNPNANADDKPQEYMNTASSIYGNHPTYGKTYNKRFSNVYGRQQKTYDGSGGNMYKSVAQRFS